MITKRSSMLLVLVLVLGACSHATPFRSDAFYSTQYPYRVVFEPGSAALLPEQEWMVDNYQVDKQGRLTEPKVGGAYETSVSLDTDGDGTYETTRRLPRYDLKLLHRTHAGAIWLQVSPVSARQRDTQLRILAESYVENVAGAGQVLVSLGPQSGVLVGTEKRFATRILELHEASVDGVEAVDMTFEVANVDQLQLSADSRWERARIVLLRPAFQFAARGSGFPVVIQVGYSNRPEDFEGGEAALESLLARLHLMSDQELVDSQSEALFGCAGTKSDTVVAGVDQDDDGKVQWGYVRLPDQRVPQHNDSEPPTCEEKVLQDLPFAYTGARRRIELTLARGAALRAPRGFQRGATLIARAGATESEPAEAAAPEPTASPPAVEQPAAEPTVEQLAPDGS